MSDSRASIRFIVGARQVFAVPRVLTTVSCSLDRLMAGGLPDIPPLPPESDGYRFLSIPADQIAAVLARFPGYLVAGRQDYARRYIAMDGTFDEYMARFSGKTRSTLKRKKRKLAELADGAVDVAAFASPDEMDAFFSEALPLSDGTYQARLLDAGLPADAAFLAESIKLAQADRLRAYILRVGGKAAAYLYLPVADDTLIYAYLGYAPELAHASPGTVLQLEALERLFAERRFRHFDFTEGDGAHKAMFATGAAQAASFYLLRPTMANRAIVAALEGFNGVIAAAKTIAARTGVMAAIRKGLRQ